MVKTEDCDQCLKDSSECECAQEKMWRYLDEELASYLYNKVANPSCTLFSSAERAYLNYVSFDPFEHGYSSDEVFETKKLYCFPNYFVGRCGYLVDKKTHAVIALGSGLAKEKWLWAYHQGFSIEYMDTIRINDIHNIQAIRASRFIPQNVTINTPLKSPIRAEVHWLHYNNLICAKANGWYDFEVIPGQFRSLRYYS